MKHGQVLSHLKEVTEKGKTHKIIAAKTTAFCLTGQAEDNTHFLLRCQDM